MGKIRRMVIVNDRILIGRVADPEADMRSVAIACIGTSPLIMNKFSEEVMSVIKRESFRDRAAACIYRNPAGKVAIPNSMLCGAVVAALRCQNSLRCCRSAEDIISEVIRFEDEFTVLSNGHDEREPDWVCHVRHISPQTSRHRGLVYTSYPRFDQWGFVINISYDHNMILREKLVRLFQMAGQGQGLGLYRPNKKGPYGAFRVREWNEQTS